MRPALLPRLVLAAALGAALGVAPPATPSDERPDPPERYRQLREARLEPAGELRDATLRIDRVELTFEHGQLYLAPEIGGHVTGAVFLGDGRVLLDPPDAVEREQLDRHLESEAIDMEFERLVLRFSDDTAERLRSQAVPGGRVDTRRAQGLWKERHDKAGDERLFDVDARVLADLVDLEHGTADPRGGLLWADIDADHWFSVEIDPGRQEEVFVTRSRGRDRLRDVWTAFHLREEYALPEGSDAGVALAAESWTPPGQTPETAVDLYIDDNGSVAGTAWLRIVPSRPLSTLRLLVSPVLEVDAVSWRVADGDLPALGDLDTGDAREPTPLTGEAVPFVQDHFGRGMNSDRWDPRVTVLLPRAFAAGEDFEVGLHYHGDLIERLQNRDYVVRDTESWYPRLPGARRTRMQMVFRTRSAHRVATAGEPLEEIERDGTRIERYRVAEPTTNMGFHYGDLDPRTDDAATPTITVYGSPNTTGFAPGNRERTLADLRDAFAMYEQYFGPAPVDHLTVTEIPGLGGQSFPGFLMLSFATFGAMNTGEAELFRTHEVAHQWFGNEVSWNDYRDQWMSEGFANYGAALYALNVQEEEDKFLDMLQAWRKDILNQIDVRQRLGTRYFGFTPEVLRKSDGFESGPLWIGYRLAAFDTPNDYRILAYEKGAFILHMLRMMLIDPHTGDDALFRQMMTAFYQRHRGGHPSTEQFLAVTEEHFGEPMRWFFDQWVYGSKVPTYRPDLDAERTADGWRLRGRIRQEEVPDDFRMPVPVRVTYADGDTEWLVVEVAEPSVEIDLPLRGEPEGIEFNPLESVLADVR